MVNFVSKYLPQLLSPLTAVFLYTAGKANAYVLLTLGVYGAIIFFYFSVNWRFRSWTVSSVTSDQADFINLIVGIHHAIVHGLFVVPLVYIIFCVAVDMVPSWMDQAVKQQFETPKALKMQAVYAPSVDAVLSKDDDAVALSLIGDVEGDFVRLAKAKNVLRMVLGPLPGDLLVIPMAVALFVFVIVVAVRLAEILGARAYHLL